ncbi:19420_t:CDS:1 [Dentiscutata erythropus]|uniref:19420_t:CDS:1 n=1 Tax=Dentiscutata erythropus TaxID=1348616 RepID=A0A9N9F790_9GLOM|nr:19420_t:CDS:1 [Dentiscutata erythropus]
MICTLTLSGPPPVHSIIATSTISQYTIFFARQDEEYRVIYSGLYVVFKIPDQEDVKKSVNDSNKGTPNYFILFRSILKNCISALGLNTEWVFVSEVSRELWSEIKKNDYQFVASLRNAYKFSNAQKKLGVRFKPYDYNKKFNKPNDSAYDTECPQLNSTENFSQQMSLYSYYEDFYLFNASGSPIDKLLWELFEY